MNTQSPAYSAREVSSYMTMFRDNPRHFSREQGETLQKYANYYQIPYQKDEFDYSFSIMDGVKELGEGFLSGFTTLQIGKPSLNPYENILRSVGQLAGFVGYIPAAPVSWAAKGIGIGAKTLGVGAKIFPTIAKFNTAKKAAAMTRGITSVPMWAAGKVTKKAGSIATTALAKATMAGSSGALGSVTKFLSAVPTQHIIGRAFHMGVASSVSNWQHGIDQMMKGFTSGATTGAVFAGMGEVFSSSMIGVGKPIPLDHLQNGKPIWSKISSPQKADVVMRMVAHSAYSGLPATLRGATEPEQVYEYLLGAYFGYSGVNSKTSEAQKFIGKYSVERFKTKSTGIMPDPAKNKLLKPSYDALSKGAKLLVDTEIDRTYAPTRMPAVFEAIYNLFPEKQHKAAEQAIIDLSRQLETNIKTSKTFDKNKKHKDGTEYTSMEKLDLNIQEAGRTVFDRVMDKTENFTINKESGDVGDSVSFAHVQDPSRMFFDKYVLPKGKHIDPTNQVHLRSVDEIRKVWDMMQPHGNQKDFVPQFLDYLNTGFGTKITKEVESFWRYQSNKKRYDQQQTVLGWDSDNKSTYKIDGELDPTGKRNVIRRTPLPEDIIYKSEYKKLNKKDPIGESVRFLNHGVRTNKETEKLQSVGDITGLFLSNRDKSLIYQQQLNQGFYPISGNNDKQVIKFAKWFPSVEKMSNEKIENTYKRINEFAKGVYTKDMIYATKALSINNKIGIDSLTYKKIVISNAFYDLKKNGFSATMTNTRKLFSKKSNLIRNAAAFNKRVGISDSTGYPIDGNVVNQKLKLPKGTPLRTILIEVPYKKGGNTKDITEAAIRFEEIHDGGDHLRDVNLMAMNETMGLPTMGNEMKQFAYDPGTHRNAETKKVTQYGALLNKSKTQASTTIMKKLMDKHNFDYLIVTNTAKQYGNRKVATLGWDDAKNEYTLSGDVESFDLPYESIKVTTQKKYDNHLLKNKTLAKQIGTNMLPTMFVNSNFKRLTASQIRKANDISSEIFTELVSTNVIGDSNYNTMLNKYIGNPNGNDTMLGELIKNHNKIGIKELTEAIRNPNATKFTKEFLSTITAQAGQFDMDMAIEGAMTPRDVTELANDGRRFKTTIDRFLQTSSNGFAPYLHKFANRSKVDEALTSYISRRVTKPEIGNSFEAVLGVYDLEAQHTYAKDLMNNDNIYYLGLNFRNKIIQSKVLAKALKKDGSSVKLGEVWDNKGKFTKPEREAMEDLFTTLASRMPIDSVSGSQKLKLAGFTNKKDFGILLHPRTMRMLDGADSDSDTAHIYLGGDGGFKMKWKNLIHSQKYEHGRRTIDNRIELSIEDRGDKIDPATGKSYKDGLMFPFKGSYDTSEKVFTENLQLSPYMRLEASEQSYQTRKLLSTAVNNKALIGATYAEALSRDKSYEFPTGITDKTGKYHLHIRQTPKPMDDKSQPITRFLGISTEAIKLSVDPSEVGHMIKSNLLFKKTLQSLFKHEFYLGDKNGRALNVKGTNTILQTLINEVTPKHYRGGMTKYLSLANQALFGKDRMNSRRYNEMEKKSMLRGASDFVGRNPVTFIGKFAKQLDGITWQTDFLNQISVDSYEKLFTTLNKDLRSGSLDNMKTLLKVNAKPSEFGKLIMTSGLNDHRIRENIVVNPDGHYANKLFNSKAYLDVATQSRLVRSLGEFKKLDSVGRGNAIDNIMKLGNDFMSNDINLVSQIYNINSMMKDFNISSKRVKEMSKYIGTDLKGFYNTLRERKGTIFYADVENNEGTGISSLELIDKKAIEYKRTLTPNESAVFDQIMLSPFGTGGKLTHGRLPLSLPSTSNMAIMVMNDKMNGIFSEMKRIEGLGQPVLSRKSMDKVINTIMKDNMETDYKRNDYLLANATIVADGNKTQVKVEGSQHINELKLLTTAKAGKLNSPEKHEIEKLKNILEELPAVNVQTLPGLFKHIMNGKDMGFADLSDIKAFNVAMSDIAYASTSAQLEPILTYNFGKEISRKYMKFSMEFETQKVPYINSKGNIDSHGYALRPIETIAFIQGTAHDRAIRSEALRNKLGSIQSNDLNPYYNSIGFEISEELFSAATGKLEFPIVDSAKLTREQKIEYKKNFDHTKEVLNKYGAQKFDITFGSDKTKTMTGEQVIDTFVGLSKKYGEMGQYLTQGNPADLEQYQVREFLKKGNKRISTGKLWWRNHQDNYLALIKQGYVPDGEPLRHPVTDEIVYDFIKYSKNITEASAVLKDLPNLGIGLDGRRSILNSMLKTVFSDNPIKMELLNKIKVEPTNVMKNFFHHTNFPEAVVGKHLLETMKRINNNNSMTKLEKQQTILRLQSKFKLTPNEMSVKSIEDELLDVISTPAVDTVNEYQASWMENNRKLNHMKGRSTHMPGWDKSPGAWTTYFGNISRNLYKLDAQIASHHKIYDFYFKNRKSMGDALANRHADFYKIFTQGAMGFSTNIPKYIKDNPDMHIDGTLFQRLANDNVANVFTRVGRKLGLLDSPIKTKDANGIDIELRKRLKKYEFTERDIMWISNMEAKYELASLLSHPKTFVTNIYGGQLNNLVNAGFGNLVDARKINYLSKINPDWRSMEDVQKFVNGLGVIEEFIIHQIGLNPTLTKGKYKGFFSESLQKISKDPGMSDVTLKDIAKKYQISDTILEKAAWFMRKSERILRRDSFMTHYVQSYKNWGERLPYDHPYLIKQGLAGVKATQFLYSAPFKPMFANTAAGKVLSRFQLWAWNNVRLKKDIMIDAHKYGFKEGTESFNRFKRMATTDILTLGLANAFMYSIFESALPAPWNWVQDFGDWVFGDDKERDKSFFGAYPTAVAPLQMITPPAFRLVPPTIKALVRNDFSQIGDYHIWSMFPFGRIGRDIFGKGNIIENPYRIVEKVTGIPYRQMANTMIKAREEDPWMEE